MANFPAYERIIWFNRQVKHRNYPNATNLADHFEISSKTAQRNIDFLHDRFGAPLTYDPSQKGYCYSDKTFELPRFPVDQQEILAILIARNLLSGSAGAVISRALNNFEKNCSRRKSPLEWIFPGWMRFFLPHGPDIRPPLPKYFETWMATGHGNFGHEVLATRRQQLKLRYLYQSKRM